MVNLRKLFRTATLAGILPFAFATGCSDKEDVQTTVDQDTAQQQALGAVEVVNVMMSNVDEVVAGDFTGLSASMRRVQETPAERADPIWDGDEGRWVLAESVTGPEGSVAYYFTIQFLNASGDPQMEPDETTSRTAFAFLFDLDAVSTENGDDLQVDLHYETAMNITDLQTAIYDVEAAGALTGEIKGSKDGQNVNYDLDLSWAVHADVPADGGCGSGEILVTIEPYTLAATYSADSQTYAWTFSEGATQIAYGTGTAPCATAAAKPDLYAILGIDR